MQEHYNQDRDMLELTGDFKDSELCNADILPTKIENRHWNRWNIAALWIGMAVCIPTYMLAASLLNQGMNWWQAILTIMLGNVIVLVPMLLTSHPGTKYGIPFPVLSRASFGNSGAHIPSILRSLVACGWFGIQTWIGGQAIYTSICILWPGFGKLAMLPTGINLGQLISFLIFWGITMLIVMRGIESIRWLEDWSAPVLLIIGLALMCWGVYYGGGFRKILAESYVFTKPAVCVRSVSEETVTFEFHTLKDDKVSRVREIIVSEEAQFDEQGFLKGKRYPYSDHLSVSLAEGSKGKTIQFNIQFTDGKAKSSLVSCPVTCKTSQKKGTGGFGFWVIFFPALTAMIGYWATLSLNIPDFTRYGKSQKEQMAGQIIGLPTTMTFYSFVGLVSTCAGLLIFKDILIASDAPWDPVKLLSNFNNPVLVFIAMFALAIATLSTNLAANVVAPANGFSNLFPRRISFKAGSMITGLIGLFMFPWKVLESTQGYIFTWLIGYSALLGPIAGIVICDYFIIRKRKLSLEELYKVKGKYHYSGGFNMVAVTAIILGVLPNIPGFLASAGFIQEASVSAILKTMYTYAWFVGFFISFVIYGLGMKFSNYPKD